MAAMKYLKGATNKFDNSDQLSGLCAEKHVIN